jgi:hypothetical protein
MTYAGDGIATPVGGITAMPYVGPVGMEEPATFQLLGGNVWMEITITAATLGGGAGICVNPGFGKDPSAPAVFVTPNIGGTATAVLCGSIFEVPPPWPDVPGFDNKTLTLPYTVQTRVNGSTGEVSYEDTAGNSGSLGIYPALIGDPIFEVAIAGDITGVNTGTITAELNIGYTEPVIAPLDDFSIYKNYCNLGEVFVCGSGAVCDPLVFSIAFESEASTVLNGNEVTTTSLDLGAPVGTGFYTENILRRSNTCKWAFEVVMQQPTTSELDRGVGASYGQINPFDPGPIGGIALGGELGGLTYKIGLVDNLFAAPTPILTNLTISFPWVVKVVYNGDTISFKDNQVPANTGVLGTVLGLSNFLGGGLFLINSVEAGIGNSQTSAIEGQVANWIIDFENDAISWCNLEDATGGATAPYELIEVSATNGGNLSSPRVAGWETIGSTSSQWFGNLSYSLLNTVVLDSRVFEVSVLASDNGGLSDTGGLTFYYTNTDFLGAGDLATIGLRTDLDTVDGRHDVSIVSTDGGDPSYSSALFLFQMASDLGFVAALIVIDNNSARLVYKSSKETVFFDAISVNPYGPNVSPILVLTEGGPTDPSSGDSYRVGYSGIEADYSITGYPDGSTDYKGDPITTNFETKTARWLLDYDLQFAENIGLGEYVDITGGGYTATAITTFNQSFWLNCARLIKAGFGLVAVTYQINGLVTGGTNPNGFRLQLEAVNRNSYCVINFSGLNLILSRLTNGVLQTEQIIKTNYVAAAGDQLCLVMDSTFGLVEGILQQGGVLHRSGPHLIDQATNTTWMPRAGHQNANGNTMVIANQYEAATIPPGVLKTDLQGQGAVDILLDLI